MTILKRISYLMAVAVLFLTACDPKYKAVNDFAAPDNSQVNFTITNVDDFHVKVTNTSTLSGLLSWDLGEGSKSSDKEATIYFPMPGEYKITLSIYTKGGIASSTKTFTQTKTDYSIFSDPTYVNLTGGASNANGKTWVLDTLQKGHIGVGPSDNPAGTGLEWWSCDPLGKSGTAAYDDEINFNLNGFVTTYNNKGKSYVKGYRKDNAAYSNPVQNKDDWDVTYATPVTGAWSISIKDGVYYLKINSAKPLFPCFDVGAKDDEYKIVQVSENQLELTCFSADESWTRWHYYLIPKGYVKPTITFDASLVEGVDNNVACSTVNYSIPAGASVTDLTWDFGDGSAVYTTTNKDEVVNHIYMRKGTYTATVKVNTSLGLFTKTKSISLANNNSAYVPYLLNAMVMYNDAAETILVPMAFDNAGQSGSVETVANPNNSQYPNRSLNVFKYTKNSSQWANAFFKLPVGYRFDLRQQHIVKLLVYGEAGAEVLLKFENTDRGGNAWQTGSEIKHVIQTTNKWEVMVFDFNGVSAGWDWTGDIFTSDVVADARFNHEFYNVIRIMYRPGDGSQTYSFHFDDLAGPHVEGLKK